MEASFFVRPRKDVGDFDLSLLIDEDIVGSDITDLSVDRVEVSGAADQAVEQVPQLLLLKVLVHVDSVLDFLLKKIRIVLVEDLYLICVTLTEPTLPQNPLGVNSCLTGIKSASLSSKALSRLKSLSQALMSF